MSRINVFKKSGQFLLRPHRGIGDLFLVHGSVWSEAQRRYVPWAWIEFALQFKASRLMIKKDKGKRHVRTAVSMVLDRSLPKKMRIMTKDSYYALFRVRIGKRYNKDEACKKLASYRHWGPWQ